jgi:hypothetical protein
MMKKAQPVSCALWTSLLFGPLSSPENTNGADWKACAAVIYSLYPELANSERKTRHGFLIYIWHGISGLIQKAHAWILIAISHRQVKSDGQA